MPLDAAFKIIFSIHLSTLSLSSRSLCLLHNTSNFLPFLFLTGKDLFNLHCPKLSSSCRYRRREEFSAICHHSKIGFWGWVFFLGGTGECRQRAFLICLQLIRRQPKVHMGGLHLSVHQPETGGWRTGFQSCLLPKSGICQRRILLAVRMVKLFFVGPAIQKRGKGAVLCLPLGILLHIPVGPAALWIRRLNSKVKDINSYRELSAAELKRAAWPL